MGKRDAGQGEPSMYMGEAAAPGSFALTKLPFGI